MGEREEIRGRNKPKPTQAFGHPIMKEFTKMRNEINHYSGFQGSKKMPQISPSIKEEKSVPIMKEFTEMPNEINHYSGFQKSISPSIKEEKSVQFTQSRLPVSSPDSVPPLSLSERIRQRIEIEEKEMRQ